MNVLYVNMNMIMTSCQMKSELKWKQSGLELNIIVFNFPSSQYWHNILVIFYDVLQQIMVRWYLWYILTDEYMWVKVQAMATAGSHWAVAPPLTTRLRRQARGRVILSVTVKRSQGSRWPRDLRVPRENRRMSSGKVPANECWNIEKNNSVSQDEEQQQRTVSNNACL